MKSLVELLEKIKTNSEKKEGNINLFPSSTQGTEIFSGQFFEEYLNEIQGREWAFKVDEMRRSSDQISMLASLVKIPVINAMWNIEVPEELPNAEEIHDFLEFALFKKINFKQFIQECTTFVEFGYSLFEPIYEPLINHPKYGYGVVLKKISYISQKTVDEWKVSRDGDLQGIKQYAQGDLENHLFIEGSKLLHFAIGQEGANYEGRSLLRPIFGNWKRKQQFLKILAIGIERASMGTPIGKAAPNAPEKAVQSFKKMLRSLISYERSAVVIPDGYSVDNMQINFDADKVQNAIKAERVGMSQAFLAGFMELGTNSDSGSFALSSNLLNIFMSSIQIYADIIADGLNKDIIKKLTMANFGRMEDYPQIKASNISDKIGAEFADILVKLTNAGYIQATPEMSLFLKRKFNLPEERIEVSTPITEEPKQENDKEKEENSFVDTNKSLELSQSSSANKQIEIEKAELESLMIDTLIKRRDKLLENTRKILKRNNTKSRRKEVIDQNIPDATEYKRLIADFLINSSLQATNEVKKELGISGLELAEKEDLNKLTSDTKSRIRSEVDLIIETQDADLKKSLFFVFNNNLDNTDSVESLLTDMKKGSDKFINGSSITIGAANFVSNAVNNARNDIYQNQEVFGDVESFTIVNPSPKAEICKELAGRTITKEEYINGDLPPYHHNCNTIVVANTKGSKNNPQVNPLGLTFTGSKEKIERIIKSRTL